MNGGQAVSNYQSRSPAHEFGDGFHDRVFGARVQSAGRFVQQKDRRILEKSPCNPDPLALPHAEVATSFPHRAIESLRHAHDEVVGLRAPGGLQNLFIFAPGRP